MGPGAWFARLLGMVLVLALLVRPTLDAVGDMQAFAAPQSAPLPRIAQGVVPAARAAIDERSLLAALVPFAHCCGSAVVVHPLADIALRPLLQAQAVEAAPATRPPLAVGWVTPFRPPIER